MSVEIEFTVYGRDINELTTAADAELRKVGFPSIRTDDPTERLYHMNVRPLMRHMGEPPSIETWQGTVTARW